MADPDRAAAAQVARQDLHAPVALGEVEVAERGLEGDPAAVGRQRRVVVRARVGRLAAREHGRRRRRRPRAPSPRSRRAAWRSPAWPGSSRTPRAGRRPRARRCWSSSTRWRARSAARRAAAGRCSASAAASAGAGAAGARAAAPPGRRGIAWRATPLAANSRRVAAACSCAWPRGRPLRRQICSGLSSERRRVDHSARLATPKICVAWDGIASWCSEWKKRCCARWPCVSVRSARRSSSASRSGSRS